MEKYPLNYRTKLYYCESLMVSCVCVCLLLFLCCLVQQPRTSPASQHTLRWPIPHRSFIRHRYVSLFPNFLPRWTEVLCACVKMIYYPRHTERMQNNCKEQAFDMLKYTWSMAALAREAKWEITTPNRGRKKVIKFNLGEQLHEVDYRYVHRIIREWPQETWLKSRLPIINVCKLVDVWCKSVSREMSLLL